MIDIALAVGSVKSAIEIAKTLKDSTDLFDKAEVKLQLAELIGSLADAKMQIAEIQESLIDSEQEKKELLKKIEIKENIIYEKPYYWRFHGDVKDGPFCQRCYDVNEKSIRLQGGNNDVWSCKECENSYRGSNYQRPNLTTSFRVI